jgi:hypothetical protein
MNQIILPNIKYILKYLNNIIAINFYCSKMLIPNFTINV